MPKDKAGKFHLNKQKAMASDKMPAKPSPAPPMDDISAPPMDAGPVASPAHDALVSIHASGGGKHAMVSGDGMGGHQMHTVGEDGQTDGPHDFDNLETLKQALEQFFTEEEQEGGAPGYGMPMEHGEI